MDAETVVPYSHLLLSSLLLPILALPVPPLPRHESFVTFVAAIKGDN